MSCCLKTTLKDQKQHALKERAASVFGGGSARLKPYAKTQSIIYCKAWMV